MIERDKPATFFAALAKQFKKPAPRPQQPPARPAPSFAGGGGRRPGKTGCNCGGKR